MPRRTEDRPRESKQKLQEPAEGQPPPPPECDICRFRFTEQAIKGGSGYWQRSDGSIVCQDDRRCRMRKLTEELGRELEGRKPNPDQVEEEEDGEVKPDPEADEWLWFKYPRQRLFVEMDPRPKDWKAIGWMPRANLESRILACVRYHSWCYPVCLRYAVQLAGTCPRPGRVDRDPDEMVLNEMKQPRPLRVIDIARILNEHAPNVCRSIVKLQATLDLTVDEDGWFYPTARLEALTISQRRELYAHELDAVDPELRAVPKRFRNTLTAIQAYCPDDLSSDIFRAVLQKCSAFNDKLKDIRTERDSGIDAECKRGTILIPEFESSKSSSSVVQATPVGEPNPEAEVRPQSGRAASNEELYAAGYGKQALGKLPSPRPPASDAPKRIAEAVGIEEEVATKIWEASLRIDEDITPTELQKLIEIKAQQLEGKRRRGEIANMPGLLIHAIPKMVNSVALTNVRKALRDEIRLTEAEQEVERYKNRKFAEQILSGAVEGSTELEKEWARGVLGTKTQGAGGDD